MKRCLVIFLALLMLAHQTRADQEFAGIHFRGRGDVEYLQLLDISRRMFEPDPEFQNLAMLYTPKWNGLVEGPTWNAWWIQNSYGPTYCALPFLREPFVTFLQNSQDLWFDRIGDGKIADKNGYVAPDGCLVDCASNTEHYYRQGDGRHDIHDWFMEATAAGVLLQSELLLISRDSDAIHRYLPKLQRAADFIEMRRDRKTGLYLAGAACHLLAPSFAGYKKPDGTFGRAYHAGLLVTYIAALDRLVELEKLTGHRESASEYERRRAQAKQALPKLVADEGYFVNSIDPDGTKHGVFGAPTHGYFESSVNHDAIAFRVADDQQAKKIYAKIASIPQLRPNDFIIPNYPSYDDMYEKPEGLWSFGHWVNGGHWSTCEARMILAYYRLGKFDDARRSMQGLLKFARRFRMDNPLTNFGADVYQPKQPINLTYDAFGPPAAMVRGLFEYLYRADGLTLVPHIPPTITQLRQLDPVRFGQKKLYLTTTGTGPITAVTINETRWSDLAADQIHLPYDRAPKEARIVITLGSGVAPPLLTTAPRAGELTTDAIPAELKLRASKLRSFQNRLNDAGLQDSYEYAHAELALKSIDVISQRATLLKTHALTPLPEASQRAADQSYIDAATWLYDGLETALARDRNSADPIKRRISEIWSSN